MTRLAVSGKGRGATAREEAGRLGRPNNWKNEGENLQQQSGRTERQSTRQSAAPCGPVRGCVVQLTAGRGGAPS